MTSYKYQWATFPSSRSISGGLRTSRFHFSGCPQWVYLATEWIRSFIVNTRFWMHISFAFNRKKQLSIELWNSTNPQSSCNLQKQSRKMGKDVRTERKYVELRRQIWGKEGWCLWLQFLSRMQGVVARRIIISPHICLTAVCVLDYGVCLLMGKTTELHFHGKTYQEKRHA